MLLTSTPSKSNKIAFFIYTFLFQIYSIFVSSGLQYCGGKGDHGMYNFAGKMSIKVSLTFSHIANAKTGRVENPIKRSVWVENQNYRFGEITIPC